MEQSEHREQQETVRKTYQDLRQSLKRMCCSIRMASLSQHKWLGLSLTECNR